MYREFKTQFLLSKYNAVLERSEIAIVMFPHVVTFLSGTGITNATGIQKREQLVKCRIG